MGKVLSTCLPKCILKNTRGAREMALWVKVLPTKPGNLCLIPTVHVEEEENRLLQAVLTNTPAVAHSRVCPLSALDAPECSRGTVQTVCSSPRKAWRVDWLCVTSIRAIPHVWPSVSLRKGHGRGGSQEERAGAED